MSVLIKGMEMPTTCCNCKFREPFMVFAYCHLAEMDMEYEESDNCRHPKCPLIEIPTPHGRLVDLDKMVDEYWDGSSMRIGKIDIKDIEEYDTVIEAEGSEE